MSKFKHFYAQELVKQYTPASSASSSPFSANAALIALDRAHIAALHTCIPTSALSLLLDSERIYEDLELALEYQHTSEWNQMIVLREWMNLGNAASCYVCVYVSEMMVKPVYVRCVA